MMVHLILLTVNMVPIIVFDKDVKSIKNGKLAILLLLYLIDEYKKAHRNVWESLLN